MYVGKTYHIKKRIACHKHVAKKGSNLILHNSIKKYGWDQHLFSILEEVEDEQMDVREMYWIATLHTYCYENKMGLNMTRGGEGQRTTWMHDTKRRAEASDKFSGNKNPFYGKVHSAETKATIGAKASKRQKEAGRTVPKWGTEKRMEQLRVPVVVYDKNGDFIAEYISMAEAARQLKLSNGDVSAVILNKQISAGGMFFKKKDGDYLLKIDVTGIKIKRVKAPVLWLNDSMNVIKEFESAREAARQLNMSQASIARAALQYKGRPLRSGHRFVYKDEYEINQVINN